MQHRSLYRDAADILIWNFFIGINGDLIIRSLSGKMFIHRNCLIFHCQWLPKNEISFCENGKMIFINFRFIFCFVEKFSRFIQQNNAVFLQLDTFCQYHVGKRNISCLAPFLILRRNNLIGNQISKAVFFSVCFFCHLKMRTVDPYCFIVCFFFRIICGYTGQINNFTSIHLLCGNTIIFNHNRCVPFRI